MPTYLMSYPSMAWRGSILSTAAAHPFTAQAGGPRQALKEWMTLADAITRAGGQILVMAPPAASLAGALIDALVYPARFGQLLGVGEHLSFVLGQGEPPDALGNVVEAFLTEAGVTARRLGHPWQGQVDLVPAGSGRFIAMWGHTTSHASVDALRPLLPPGTRLLAVERRADVTCSDVCLGTIVNRAGDTVVLAHPQALVDTPPEALRRFVAAGVEVYPVDAADVRAGACGILAVGGTLLVPRGLSSALRGQLVRRGFLLTELDLPALLSPPSATVRAVVNELRGMVVTPQAPTYALLRDSLANLASGYPEVAASG